MEPYTYMIAGDTLYAKIEGKSYSLTSDHKQFATIRDALIAKEPADVVVDLFDEALAAVKFMHNEIEARDGVLYFRGEKIDNVMATRIIDFMGKGIPYQPLLKCLERLLENPSRHSVQEAYPFIERNELPITEDGFILCYKGIDENWKDQWTHTIDYSIGGTVPRMPRNMVDDNWRVLCSSGYHVGSLSYATGHGARTVIVKVNPADIVSVPEGAADYKMRVCWFEVLQECEGKLPERVALTSDPYKAESAVLAFLRRLFGVSKRKN